MTEVVQAIFIRDNEIRSKPKPHVVYKIEVHAAVRNWSVWKRYSEFCTLDSQFRSMFPKQLPPQKLPPKRYFPSTFSDPQKVEERRQGLEAYLRAILVCKDERWRETDIWKDFLAIPITKSNNNTTQNTSASLSGTSNAIENGNTYHTSESWLDEHNTMVDTTREIRSLMNKRTTHLARHEVSASHNCTVQAKKLLMNLSSRLSNLEAGLNGLSTTLSDGELRRRQDMLNTLKDEKDTLMKLASTSRQIQQDQELYSNSGSSTSSVSSAGKSQQRHQQHQSMQSTDIASNHTNTLDRNALLGSAIKGRAGSGRRAFGAALKKQQELAAKETEVTRGLDNGGLVQYQKQVMQDQDDQITQFGAILSRQKQLGIAIGHELETQNQILDELDADVDRTQTKLKYANKKLGKIK